MPEQALSSELMRSEKRGVAMNSVIAALLITALKIVVGISTASLGILSEAAHSGLDLLAALITLLSVRVSDKPADADHQTDSDIRETVHHIPCDACSSGQAILAFWQDSDNDIIFPNCPRCNRCCHW